MAARGLAKMVREEMPQGYTLSRYVATYGTALFSGPGVTPEEIDAIREFEGRLGDGA